MIFNKANFEDIKKYYEKTWVKFPRLEGDTLWHVDRVTSDMIEVTSDAGEEALFSLNKDYPVDFVLPGKAVYQFGQSAAYLSRIPARMWKKGMSANNTQFKILTGTAWKPLKFDINVIKAFVNKPDYMDPYNAVKSFEKFALDSAAINPRISMNQLGSVFLDEVMIAKLDFAKDVLTTREIYIPTLEPIFYKSKMKGLSSRS